MMYGERYDDGFIQVSSSSFSWGLTPGEAYISKSDFFLQ